SDYEETYRMLSDTELRPSGLVGNTDAERTIGARAMESAKKTLRKKWERVQHLKKSRVVQLKHFPS
ncbi:hypothetical protein ONO57_26840, partial [Salmonella enterica subsp. enterica serovar Anatum]|nr:hypothetical protein [Salmonella enterica subsp. enterica serovar Anatum]